MMNYLLPITNLPANVVKFLSFTGLAGDTMPAVKKRKLAAAEATAKTPPLCYITRLPTELVSDVLSYVNTPREILNLARTCRFFCAMLTSRDTTFVWRRARRRAIPSPIPDPTPNFTESSYAAFIFDGGRCCICHKDTKHMLHSYALRVRLCGSMDCRVKWKKTCVVAKPSRQEWRPHLLQWTPSVECTAVVQWSSIGATTRFWPSIDIFYLKKDYEANEASWDLLVNKAPNAVTSFAHVQYLEKVKAPRVKEIMEHAVALYRWREAYLKQYWEVKNHNETLAKNLATEEGWEAWDVLTSHTFASFYRARNNEHVHITKKDITRMKHTIKVEVEKIVEKRRVREKEAKTRSRQDSIKEHWQHLRTTCQHEAMPTLQVFRELPVPQLLLRQGDVTFEAALNDTEIFAKLRDPRSIVACLLEDNLQRWRDDVRRALGMRLGAKKFSGRNSKLIHPAERLNARYICTKCNRAGDGYQEDGSMSFIEACAHTCFNLDKAKREKQKWDAAQFEPASKIISAASVAMTLADIDPAQKTSVTAMRNIGSRFMCTACPSKIVMDFNLIIGHAERHENMQMTLLSEAEADAILTQPLELGLCRSLLQKVPEKNQKDVIALSDTLGCRHCLQAIDITTKAPAGQNHTQPHPPRKEKLRNLNALRSHLKALHGVHIPRDEDIFRVVL